jgi:NAD(P)-dependent dehydrogenase (short-subunit alcohol dehydrogenase family)
MDITSSVAVVTGANRGLGRHFAQQLLDRGAAKVYAGARDPETVDLAGAIPLRVDVTDPASLAAAAAIAGDATILINNAGILLRGRLDDGDLDAMRLEMETNYFGPLQASRAFVPVLRANGGGAILNVLSVLSWLHVPEFGSYSASKAAGWALSNALRQELAPDDIHVAALHVGYMDTDMARNAPPEMKNDPAVVAALALDALEAGEPEILADELTRNVRAGLAAA